MGALVPEWPCPTCTPFIIQVNGETVEPEYVVATLKEIIWT